MCFLCFSTNLFSQLPGDNSCYDAAIDEELECDWTWRNGATVTSDLYPGCEFRVSYAIRTCINLQGEEETQIKIERLDLTSCVDAIEDIWPTGTSYNWQAEEELQQSLFKDLTRQDFQEKYDNALPEDKPNFHCQHPGTTEEPCGTGTVKYGYYTGNCMAKCEGYEYIPGWSELEAYAEPDEYIQFDYDPGSDHLTMEVDGKSPMTVTHQGLKDAVVDNGTLVIDYKIKWWWPYKNVYKVVTNCTDGCCQVKRSLCWCPTLNNGQGGIQEYEEETSTGASVACPDEYPEGVNQCQELSDYYDTIDFEVNGRIAPHKCEKFCEEEEE